jgi:hypothetical protein
MRAIVALLLIAIVIMIVLVAIFLAIARRREARAPWDLREESDGEAMRVLAVRPGQEPLEVARVPFADADFDSRLFEARSEGRARVSALNQKS